MEKDIQVLQPSLLMLLLSSKNPQERFFSTILFPGDGTQSLLKEMLVCYYASFMSQYEFVPTGAQGCKHSLCVPHSVPSEETFCKSRTFIMPRALRNTVFHVDEEKVKVSSPPFSVLLLCNQPF
jgi:hypothetical protein